MNQSNCKQAIYRAAAAGLVTVLTFPSAMMGQAPVAPAAAPMSQSLRILPLAGNNAVNDLERQVMTPLAVQVLDQNDRPVEGANVIFRFPLTGPSATYANQQTAQTVQTGANGQARSTGWSANSQPGTFAVQVTASRGSEQGLGIITMTNVTRILPESEIPRKHWWSSKWAKIAYVAAAGAIVTTIVVKNTGSNDRTITGGPGVPVIGGPQ